MSAEREPVSTDVDHATRGHLSHQRHRAEEPSDENVFPAGATVRRATRRLQVPREALVLLLLYLAYTLTRLLAADDLGEAAGNAEDLLVLEGVLRFDVESAINRAVAETGWAATLTSYWYASLHYVVTLGVLILSYRRAPAHYVRLRTTLVVASLLALLGYVLLPTAPPRLTIGYTDVLAETSEQGWWGADASAPRGLGGATNELAAMPSMHVGWAVWVALALREVLRTPSARALVWVYPAMTAFVVIGTGNHWTLDAVAGAGLVVLVHRVVSIVRPDRNQRAASWDREAPTYTRRSSPHHCERTTSGRSVPGTVVRTREDQRGAA